MSEMSGQYNYRHQAATIWMTGFSGAGKSTIAEHLFHHLSEQNCYSFILDGDVLRHGLCKDLGFSIEDRKENMRRVGEVAKLFTTAGIITIVALISPLKVERAAIRALFSAQQFLEVYCNASLEICEQRDVKGLYKKARRGEIPFFTGIDSPYEQPEAPELILDTANTTVEECVLKLMELLHSKGIIFDY